MTFEDYLEKSGTACGIEFRLVAVKSDGPICFYIHPTGKDGETVDFRVQGNTLIQIECAVDPDSPEKQPEVSA
jgi:hypothetical protein